MNRHKQDRDSIALSDRSLIDKMKAENPKLNELISTFDLEFQNGDIIPDTRIQNEYRFSLFYNGKDNTKNTIPRKEINLSELVQIIQSDKLKNLPKKERPYITPYGTFTKRNNDSLVHFNNDIICLDYDKLRHYQRVYILDYWVHQECTLLCVVSPSGNGLKVLLKAEHGFNPETLYNGLKTNSELFGICRSEVDLMQFVLCQPMFIPYSENPYFNPHAEPMKVHFKQPLEASASVPVIDEIKVQETKNLNRVNRFFLNRVNMLLDNLKQRPRNTGTHAYIYSILMRLYPYLNQQTAIQEHELTNQLESIISARYNGDKSQVKALHRSIAKAKEHQLNLVELINQTAKVKI